ncbi:hypothetical protein ACN4EG_19990 [Alkalinema pantanalense CENA528]|uniref:hypothetical protein n=1 Tax=Alkalinema pantanalense TaxID=1620705 RepID=UPI003D6E057A
MKGSSDTNWIEVPDDFFSEWTTIFYASTEGLTLSSPCPICHHNAMHCIAIKTRQFTHSIIAIVLRSKLVLYQFIHKVPTFRSATIALINPNQQSVNRQN